MKIFERPLPDSHRVQSCLPSSLLSPSIVPRTKLCSRRHYRMWLDKSTVRKYIHYNNVDFRHEMLSETPSYSLLSAWFLIRCYLKTLGYDCWMSNTEWLGGIFKPPTNSHRSLIIDRPLILIIGSNLNRELFLLFFSVPFLTAYT